MGDDDLQAFYSLLDTFSDYHLIDMKTIVKSYFRPRQAKPTNRLTKLIDISKTWSRI